MIHWRRYRTHALVRLWDKDFTLIGTQRVNERVEPWWRWARRLAADVAATLRRRRDRRPAHVTVDEPEPRRVHDG
jgi:hypothetical protein